ncbi:DUF2637 domain-containing protein [Dactylosporangium sp. AC04546]|uniref:DUF2637 domain-containing protein n=1 Tax=Dactylosporangium sp. AC04546 TaxID=2862460 RepID=UPI001EE080AB|nr:DUF2637 domain-containing protein [Dactylosporangium sp. AC04546]WVK83950.1 DUF2637 domain-containing protein [Dactylosporangium sp. AC04546]
MNERKLTGRGWAYAGALLGGAVSVAANVAHSYVPPAGSDAGWSPDLGAVVGAVFWPIAVFVAVEILARTVWPTGRGWTALRFLGLLPVALVAALVSYRHLSGLLSHYGEDGLTAVIGPLAVDGLMVMATGALIATGRRQPVVEPEPIADPEPTVTPQPAPVPTAPTAEPEPPVAPVAEVKPVRKAPKRQPSAAQRVAAAVTRSPKASDATIAARLGLSEATVKRHRRQSVDSVSTPTLKAA